MTPDERGLLLKEAGQIKTKLRAVRRNCSVSILLYYDGEAYPATITNLSFTGAFVECFIAIKIGDSVTVGFKELDNSVKLKLNARIVHASEWGVGIRFKSVNSNAARFLQKRLDDFK